MNIPVGTVNHKVYIPAFFNLGFELNTKKYSIG